MKTKGSNSFHDMSSSISSSVSVFVFVSNESSSFILVSELVSVESSLLTFKLDASFEKSFSTGEKSDDVQEDSGISWVVSGSSQADGEDGIPYPIGSLKEFRGAEAIGEHSIGFV